MRKRQTQRKRTIVFKNPLQGDKFILFHNKCYWCRCKLKTTQDYDIGICQVCRDHQMRNKRNHILQLYYEGKITFLEKMKRQIKLRFFKWKKKEL